MIVAETLKDEIIIPFKGIVTMLSDTNRVKSVRLLGQACTGALVGALIAMMISGFFLQVGGRVTEMPNDLLSWNLHNVWSKPREKGFYLLSLLLGPMCAYIATGRLWLVSQQIIWWFLLISVPTTCLIAGPFLQENHGFYFLYATVIVSILFFFLASRKSVQITPPKFISPSVDIFKWKIYLILLFLITILLMPISFIGVAARIGMEFHVASTLIGPSLYLLKKHLLPGIDYYTQYSIGQPWLFSFFLGKSAEITMVHYVMFAIITTWLFFTQLILLMRWLYRSWIPATIVTLLFCIILFHGDRHFFDPSSSVLRYPLVGVSAWALARWIESPHLMVQKLVLATVIALSIFFNTETGIITAIAVAFATFPQNRHFVSNLYSLLSLGIATLSIFSLLILMVFGQHAFSLDFLRFMLAPLFYFGKYGFGGTPIGWNLRDLNWFYNLVTPGIILGTLGLLFRVNNSELDRPRVAVLTFFTITGLLMMAKFINMSFVGLWQMNSLGFFVILMWWCNCLSLHYQNEYLKLPLLRYSISGYLASWIAVALSAFFLVAFCTDERNPMILGLRSWLHYPSIARSLIDKGKICKSYDCFPDKPAASDIELIKKKTKPGEQIAIIDLYDWTYLVGAHRPPLMVFTPSSIIFTKYQLLESFHRLKSTPYLFLPKGESRVFNFSQDAFKEGISLTFKDDYVYDGEGDRLVAWKRKKII